MNITLSADAQTVEQARQAAQRMGKSLNQAVRDHLAQLAGMAERGNAWDDYEARCREGGGRLNGWTFDRDEANARETR